MRSFLKILSWWAAIILLVLFVVKAAEAKPSCHWQYDASQEDAPGLGYKGTDYEIEFNIARDGIGAVIKNTSEDSIAIVWDKTRVISFDGISGAVIHSGVKYMDAGRSMPNTEIPAGAKSIETIIPAANLSNQRGWFLKPFLFVAPIPEMRNKPDPRLIEVMFTSQGIGDGASLIGKKFGLSLAIKRGEKTVPKMFRFEIKDAICK